MLPTSSTCRPSCFSFDCRPATRSAEGPMSTPRRLWPRSIGTPIMRTFCGMKRQALLSPETVAGIESKDTHDKSYAPTQTHRIVHSQQQAPPCILTLCTFHHHAEYRKIPL